ncbi:hypothetical protein CDAR_60381 [Caerostris darwini]|uniref:Uncharacterized protein n=1 Tax=Caerostris darwini TaxID=1538125 RepID=A0AAV4QP02_9ARAC|nr:hypothetical protein CDAR_60381 [Caerostris darwini]
MGRKKSSSQNGDYINLGDGSKDPLSQRSKSSSYLFPCVYLSPFFYNNKSSFIKIPLPCIYSSKKEWGGGFYSTSFPLCPGVAHRDIYILCKRRMLAEDMRNLNWRNAFYVRVVIFAHKTTLSEDGCKPCLQLRRRSSEYKFRGEEEIVGYKCSALGDAPRLKSCIGEILNISFFRDLWRCPVFLSSSALRAPTVKLMQGLPHGAQKVIYGS